MHTHPIIYIRKYNHRCYKCCYYGTISIHHVYIYHKNKIKCDKDLSVNARHKFRSLNWHTAKHIPEYIKLMPAILVLFMSQVTISRSQ